MDLLLATEWLNADPNSPEFANFPYDLDKFTIEVLYNDNGAEYAEVVFDSFDIGGATGVDEAPASYLPDAGELFWSRNVSSPHRQGCPDPVS